MIQEGISLKKNFLRFILPSIVAQWIFALYTMVDGMFVARGVSEVALAAVNIASPFVNFLFSVSLLFAVGCSTVVAIYLGQNRQADANRVYTQNMAVLLVVSLSITLLVFVRLESIALFLGATDLTLSYVKEYIASILPFISCFIIAYSFEVLVKTDGHPKFATVTVSAGCILNCILDYLFVIRLEWGVGGAGFATGLSQLAVVGIYLTHFLSKRSTIRLVRFKASGQLLWRTVKIGFSSGLTEFSAGITVFLFNHAILRHIGEEGIISYTIVAYVSTIVVMSMAGVAQGAQPLISFYYGRGEQSVCKKLLRYSLVSAVVLSAIAFVGAILCADLLVGIFISPALAALRSYSAAAFRIFSGSFLLVGFNVVISGFFTAIERPHFALAISAGRGLVMVVLALELCTLLFGGAGIWWAATVSELLCLLLTLFLLRRYRRKRPPT